MPIAPPLPARAELAPTGKFRVGIYPSNPVVVTKRAQGGDYEGMGIDVYRELARRLGVPFVAVPFSDLDKMRACVDTHACDAMFLAKGNPMESVEWLRAGRVDAIEDMKRSGFIADSISCWALLARVPANVQR